VTEPIRLLIFQNSVVRAGVEEVVLALANGLHSHGFEVHLAIPQQLIEKFGSDLKLPVTQQLSVHIVGFLQFSEIRRLQNYLRERRIQIVNSHLFYATLFAAPVARLSGVKAVVETTHGPEAWRTSWLKRRYWIDRVVELLVTRNLAVSEANRAYLCDVKRYPRHKVAVVPNGRDLDSYRTPEFAVEEVRSHWNLQGVDSILVCPGRLEPQKGHEFLIEAMGVVAKDFPSTRLLVVGEGSLRTALEQRVVQLGLQKHVVFVGFQANIAAYYGVAEIVVLPSLFEGMPLVAIEAGAAARPIVASRVDGTGEVVIDGETGLLTHPAQSQALAAAIGALLKDKARARDMGAAARRHVELNFSLDRQISDTAALLRGALKE